MKCIKTNSTSKTDVFKDSLDNKESLTQVFKSDVKKSELKKKPKVKSTPRVPIELKSDLDCMGDGGASTTNSENKSTQLESELMKELEKSKDKIVLTKKEKKCLEDIMALTVKVQDGDDDAEINLTLADGSIEGQSQLTEIAASIHESPSKLMITELGDVTAYLRNLKSLIAKRETTWASTFEENKNQKNELTKLGDEISNLLLSCGKKQTEVQDKDKIISEKDKEIVRLQKIILKLKGAILQLERRAVQQEMGTLDGINQPKCKTLIKKPGSEVLTSELEQLMLNSQKTGIDDRKGLIRPHAELRKNQGPAAQMANALYRARNAGNFVNF